jgi:hypothetical protein
VAGLIPNMPVYTVEPLSDITQTTALKSRQGKILHPTQNNEGKKKLALFLIVVALIIAIAVLVHTPQTGTSNNESSPQTGTNTSDSPAYFVPNATARGVSVVPGAIVCPSHDAVSMMFDMYAAHWEDTMQDAMTHGQARLIRGQPAPAPAPDMEAYGCALLPNGTPMMLETGNVVPVVTAKLPNGTIIRGVTLPAMIVQNQQQLEATNQSYVLVTPMLGQSSRTAVQPAPASTTPTESQGEAASDNVNVEVSRALENWAKANESNDPTLLANCYADQVDRYFLRLNVTNTFVHDYMDAWLKEHDSRVTMFKIKDVTFENVTTTTVQLRLVKEVVTTNSKGAAERLTSSQLSLKKVAGEWRITSERDFK